MLKNDLKGTKGYGSTFPLALDNAEALLGPVDVLHFGKIITTHLAHSPKVVVNFYPPTGSIQGWVWKVA